MSDDNILLKPSEQCISKDELAKLEEFCNDCPKVERHSAAFVAIDSLSRLYLVRRGNNEMRRPIAIDASCLSTRDHGIIDHRDRGNFERALLVATHFLTMGHAVKIFVPKNWKQHIEDGKLLLYDMLRRNGCVEEVLGEFMTKNIASDGEEKNHYVHEHYINILEQELHKQNFDNREINRIIFKCQKVDVNIFVMVRIVQWAVEVGACIASSRQYFKFKKDFMHKALDFTNPFATIDDNPKPDDLIQRALQIVSDTQNLHQWKYIFKYHFSEEQRNEFERIINERLLIPTFAQGHVQFPLDGPQAQHGVSLEQTLKFNHEQLQEFLKIRHEYMIAGKPFAVRDAISLKPAPSDCDVPFAAMDNQWTALQQLKLIGDIVKHSSSKCIDGTKICHLPPCEEMRLRKFLYLAIIVYQTRVLALVDEIEWYKENILGEFDYSELRQLRNRTSIRRPLVEGSVPERLEDLLYDRSSSNSYSFSQQRSTIQIDRVECNEQILPSIVRRAYNHIDNTIDQSGQPLPPPNLNAYKKKKTNKNSDDLSADSNDLSTRSKLDQRNSNVATSIAFCPLLNDHATVQVQEKTEMVYLEKQLKKRKAIELALSKKMQLSIGDQQSECSWKRQLTDSTAQSPVQQDSTVDLIQFDNDDPSPISTRSNNNGEFVSADNLLIDIDQSTENLVKENINSNEHEDLIDMFDGPYIDSTKFDKYQITLTMAFDKDFEELAKLLGDDHNHQLSIMSEFESNGNSTMLTASSTPFTELER